jgi:lambda family phage portal protein
MRHQIPEPTLWERGLAKFVPEYAAKVYRTRAAFLMAASYHGANRQRRSLSGWTTSNGDADSDLLPELSALRDSSRDLYRNNSIGGAAINTAVTSVVGTGLTLQCRLNREVLGMDDDTASAWESNTEAEFRLWATRQCDIQRQLSFYGIQELAFRSCLENGDVLVSTPYKKYKSDTYGLKIQLIEADRVCNPNHAVDTDIFSGGIERDENGVTKKHHILKSHPGNSHNKSLAWMNIPAFNGKDQRVSWLVFHKLRVGQNRGIPFLAPVIEEIKQLSRMTENEIMRAVVSSLFTVFVKTADGNGLDLVDIQQETGARTSDKDIKLGNGNIIDLAEGEEVQFADPKIPNAAFEPFHDAITKQIGARLGIPVEILLKLFNTSFTAAQAAFLEAWRFFLGKRDWLSEIFCQPIYELWLTEAVALGRISAPGFLSGDALVRDAWLGSDWIGDAPGHIKETEAISAAIMRIESGLSNEAIETTALTGRDRDFVYRQRKKEIEQRRADDMLSSSSVTLAAAQLEGVKNNANRETNG